MEHVRILENRNGEAVWISRWGASIMRVRTRDRRGELGDVVLGFDEPGRYRSDHPHLGATVGRVANRIARGRFTLDGVGYALPRNDGPHHLHGGPRGLGFRRWTEQPAPGAVRFAIESPEGDDGYPGAVRLEVTYHFDDSATLRIDFEASADRRTIVAPTNHAYWNLRDGGSSPVLGHQLRLEASHFTPADDEGIPLGVLAPVSGTPFDFRRARALGESIDAVPDRGGYDHNFVIDGEPGVLRPAARLSDPESGRVLSVSTTFPGLQVYTANGFDGSLVGRGGTHYGRRCAVCLEAQIFPDTPNQPGFPSAIVAPGAVMRHTTVYALSVA